VLSPARKPDQASEWQEQLEINPLPIQRPLGLYSRALSAPHRIFGSAVTLRRSSSPARSARRSAPQRRRSPWPRSAGISDRDGDRAWGRALTMPECSQPELVQSTGATRLLDKRHIPRAGAVPRKSNLGASQTSVSFRIAPVPRPAPYRRRGPPATQTARLKAARSTLRECIEDTIDGLIAGRCRDPQLLRPVVEAVCGNLMQARANDERNWQLLPGSNYELIGASDPF